MSSIERFKDGCLLDNLGEAAENQYLTDKFPLGNFYLCDQTSCKLYGELAPKVKPNEQSNLTLTYYPYTQGECANN